MTDQDIQNAKQELVGLRDQQKSSAEFRTNMEHIRKVLRYVEREYSTISKEFVDTFIDRIYVTPESGNMLRLDIKIFTGEAYKKYLGKLKRKVNSEGSAGHTFKENEPNRDMTRRKAVMSRFFINPKCFVYARRDRNFRCMPGSFVRKGKYVRHNAASEGFQRHPVHGFRVNPVVPDESAQHLPQ